MVLYLKYRPQKLSEVLGQESIIQTLKNAKAQNRLSHAYLFCGPRGVGKTSTARILAKIVNCPKDGEDGCEICQSIADGSNLDLIEIDAASNRGIDDVRELREKIKLSPTSLKKKVYVIDECFRYEDLVTLADGSKLPIGKIVEKALPVKILSYNESTGKLEPKPIEVYMMKKPKLPSVRITFNNNRDIVCTVNHRFYTPSGLQSAANLKVGQAVYANFEQISQFHLSILAGAAIGDGHISLTTSKMRGRLSMVHGIAQKDYLDYKVSLLGNLIRTKPHFELLKNSYSKKGTYRVSTTSIPQISDLRRELYDEFGHKKITSTYLNRITPLALAIWYMDDGSLITQNNFYKKKNGQISNYPVSRSTLYINSLTEEESNLIVQWFKQKWDIEARYCITKKGPVIWLTKEGTTKLNCIIASYVPRSMEYKLLPAFRNKFNNPKISKISVVGLPTTYIKKIERVKSPDYVYNIQVANNHNYFVRDILVANCHMLTNEAFNALLKTLEEPPSHVLFILATTEPQKIPATILSRVTRLDFSGAAPESLEQALKRVVEGEKIEIEEEALSLLVKKADSSFRDGIKLLDQFASLGQKITASLIEETLKGGKFETSIKLLEFISQKDVKSALNLVNEEAKQGTNFKEYLYSLMDISRSLLLIQHQVGDSVKKGYSVEKYKVLERLSQKFTQSQLIDIINSLFEASEKLKISSISVLPLEIAIIESCQNHELRAREALSDIPIKTPGESAANILVVDRWSESKAKNSEDSAGSDESEELTKPQTQPSNDLATLKDKWNYILETIRPYNFSLEAMLRTVKLDSIENDLVMLKVPYSFHQRILETPRNRDLLESVLGDVLGKKVKVGCVLDQRPVKVEELQNVELAADDEVIKMAAEIFNSDS